MLITMLGFITGILIGLTGTGGGVILTPLLLLFTPYPAVVVIGTDILNGAATKLLGVWEHRRMGQIRWRLAGFLIAGSVPGTLGGIFFLRFLKAQFTAGELDHILKSTLAVVLLVVALSLPWIRNGRNALTGGLLDLESIGRRALVVAAGFIVGFLVALTSIGSGSLLMIFLLLLIPLPVAGLVGTDILFGLATMTAAGVMHLSMGHFDLELFVRLLSGSLVGVVVGSRLTRRIPERYFSWLFSVLYFSLGARLLVG